MALAGRIGARRPVLALALLAAERDTELARDLTAGFRLMPGTPPDPTDDARRLALLDEAARGVPMPATAVTRHAAKAATDALYAARVADAMGFDPSKVELEKAGPGKAGPPRRMPRRPPPIPTPCGDKMGTRYFFDPI